MTDVTKADVLALATNPDIAATHEAMAALDPQEQYRALGIAIAWLRLHAYSDIAALAAMSDDDSTVIPADADQISTAVQLSGRPYAPEVQALLDTMDSEHLRALCTAALVALNLARVAGVGTLDDYT